LQSQIDGLLEELDAEEIELVDGKNSLAQDNRYISLICGLTYNSFTIDKDFR